MIIYRPSAGNKVTPVDIDNNGYWFGESLGGEIIKEKSLRIYPFNKVDSKLYSTADIEQGQQTSNWFYKNVTDFDFIKGSTTYRCVYIGCESDVNISDFFEYIDTISSVITHTSPSTYPSDMTLAQANAYIDSSISMKMWYEGKYNILSSKNTFVLHDEQDSDGKLEQLVVASGRTWQDTLTFNEYLQPGEYLKIWVKIDCSKDRSLIGYSGYFYNYIVNDLNITNIDRIVGRLNVSKVYSGSIQKSNEVDISELLSIQVKYNEILKIVENKGYTNIFLLNENNEIHDLIINNVGSVTQNKFIDYDFSSLTGAISGNSNYAFARVVECLDGNIQYFGDIKNELKPYVGKKFIIDIIPSKKDNRNYCYIFFNEMKPSTIEDPTYETKYNHIHYSWSFGVIKLDLSFSTEKEFDSIEAGYDNKKNISILDPTGVFTLRDDFYASSVILQDDLFNIVGYEIEDCKIDNKKSYITYLWEKDIILDSPKLTTTLIPKTTSTQITTVENKGNTEAYLIFNDLSKVDKESFNSLREVKELNDGKQYLKIGSPHEKEIKLGTSSLTYDMVSVKDDVSSSISFAISEASIQSSEDKTVVGTTTFDDNYPPHKHLLLDAEYKDYTEFKKVYTDEDRMYYSVQQIRQDALVIEDVNPPSYVVALTGNEQTTVGQYAHLQEILPYESILTNSVDFGRIVKLSGDGNTALIIIRDYKELNIEDAPLFSVKTSKVLVYKRCNLQWKFIKEIIPYAHDKFNIGVFFEIEDAEKIDINHDGNKIIISSKAQIGELGKSVEIGEQFDYNGYVVRLFTTSDDWSTYDQQVFNATNLMPKNQQEFLITKDEDGNQVYNYDFGYSVSISNDGNFIVIGSPSEYFKYQNKDAMGTILDEYELTDNGAAYILTINPLTQATVDQVNSAIGSTVGSPTWNPILDMNQDGVIDSEDVALVNVSYPQRDYVYGDAISGSSWNFVLRLVPHDSNEMQVGGISYKECLANGFVGKRYGEKVRLNENGKFISISARRDSQLYASGGAVYMYNYISYTNSCLTTSPLKVLKIAPSNIYTQMEFSSYSMDYSRDGSTLVVGCANEGTGVAHVFSNFDWEGTRALPYEEGTITDPSPLSAFGVDVKINGDGSIILIKNSKYVKQFINGAFTRTYTEFNKIPLVVEGAGESLDISDDGFTIAFGCVRNELVEDNRVFIFDEYPHSKGSITSSNCPTTGTSGTSGTSGSPLPPIVISEFYSIPIYYLIEVNYIENHYTVQVLTDELLPQTIIGKEVQSKEYKNEDCNIARLHCNGNTEVYALDISYNFYLKEWTLNYFSNKAQQITIIVAESGIELSPNYVNTITVNTSRKQVNGYYCGKRYAVNFEVCVNGRSLYKDMSYTFDTTNTYVLSYNLENKFSSNISYMEVRDFIENPELYNKALFNIFSNVYWAYIDQQQNNTYSQNGFENFVYRRMVSFNNLPYENKETIVVPIVLQGNAYNVDAKYSSQLRRNIFDFSVIDTANPVFGFSYEGGSKPLVWSIDSYDINKDTMVIWVKLEDWDGQRLIMHYGDLNYIGEFNFMNPFENHYAAWKMDKLLTINRLRYDSSMVYNGGEAIIVSINGDKNFVTQVDKLYMFGNAELYKSNKFDVYYDDSGVNRSREDKVKEFISNNVKRFAPGFMEIRDIKPMNNIIVESNSTVGENNGF